MSDVQYESLNLVGVHEPDYSVEVDADGSKYRQPLPGMYAVGVMAGGKFLELARFKAGGLTGENNTVAANSGPADSSSDAPASSDRSSSGQGS